jgi:energy-coupling factor transporter ATP-binding protein EcfA2
MTETLAERLARAQAERLAKENPPVDDMSAYADLIPEAVYERSDDDLQLDTVLGAIDIVTGYRKWINKSPIANTATSRRDGIKVSCPVPGHADRHPSAWLNTEKNVWFCAACDTGGDVYDLAAFYHGYPVPGYKSGATFHELRRAMAMDFGYSFTSVPGSTVPVIIAPEGDADATPLAAPTTLSVVPSAETPVVVSREPDPDDEEADIVPLWGDELPPVDAYLPWRDIVPAGTFLNKYMAVTTRDDVPEEFHFWNGMLALGFALGRNTTAFDRVPVFGNMFVCTIGDSGSGKSQAKQHLNTLLDAAMRFEPTDPIPTGVKIIRGAGSGEHLISQFDHNIPDPSRPKMSLGTVPIKGLIEYNELSALTARSDRTGSAIKPVLLEFYDASPRIGTGSIGGGTKMAIDAFASSWTSTQPKALNKLVHQSDSDSGFLNRWFFVSGREKRRVAIGGELIDIGPSVFPLQAIRTFYDGDPKMLPWSQAAHALFDKFYHDVIEPSKRADESGMLSRLDLFYKKLVLLFTANVMADEIPVEAVEQMIACHEYVMICYGVPTKRLSETSFSLIEDDVMRVIQRKLAAGKPGPTVGELSKALKRKGHRSDIVVRVLDTMTKLGQIQAIQTSGLGRPTVRYGLA